MNVFMYVYTDDLYSFLAYAQCMVRSLKSGLALHFEGLSKDVTLFINHCKNRSFFKFYAIPVHLHSLGT